MDGRTPLNPHVITFEHDTVALIGPVIRVACRCGMNGMWADDSAKRLVETRWLTLAGEWAKRHRIAMGLIR